MESHFMIIETSGLGIVETLIRIRFFNNVERKAARWLCAAA